MLLRRVFGIGMEQVWALFDHLLWIQHGGSGYHLTRNDLLAMTLDELWWFAERSNERRREEYNALRKAYNSR